MSFLLCCLRSCALGSGTLQSLRLRFLACSFLIELNSVPLRTWGSLSALFRWSRSGLRARVLSGLLQLSPRSAYRLHASSMERSIQRIPAATVVNERLLLLRARQRSSGMRVRCRRREPDFQGARHELQVASTSILA
jgi:hypothetical protein